MTKIALVLACILLAVTLVGCCGTHYEQVTVPEANAVLAEAVSLAQAHDLVGLGKLADDQEITKYIWESEGGWEAVPAEPPTVVGTSPYPNGGVVLALEGIDGKGRAYHTEFMVYRSGKFIVGNVIYWSGAGIGQ